MLARLTTLLHIATPITGGTCLAWAAQQDGITPPANPADPSSWMAWGSSLSQPVAGAVAVLTDTVGVVSHVAGAKVYVIVAGETVELRVIPRGAIKANRKPPSATLAPQPIAVGSAEQPAVTVDALQALLTHVQAEFASVHSDIETIKRTAVASVSLTSNQ